MPKQPVNEDALEAKAAALADQVEHLRTDDGGSTATFRVPSGSEEHLLYKVDARTAPRLAAWRDWRCSCPWALAGGSACSHVRAVRLRWEAALKQANGGIDCE